MTKHELKTELENWNRQRFSQLTSFNGRAYGDTMLLAQLLDGAQSDISFLLGIVLNILDKLPDEDRL